VAGALKEKIAAVNARIAFYLEESRKALRGERNFGPEQVRAISEPVAEMAPLMARAKELTAQQPEIQGEIDLYKQQLSELHTALEQVRMMLTARRGQMDQTRKQLDAVSKWAAATRLIR
jgi:phage shock protein A